MADSKDESNPALVNQTINSIFGTNKRYIDTAQQNLNGGKKKKGQGKDSELRLALTILLVELASSDQSFDMPEYNAICMGLKRVFNATREEVSALINQATLVLKNLRGTARFAEYLRDNLNDQEKLAVIDVIDEIILADGKVDGYETYLRNKFLAILGVKE